MADVIAQVIDEQVIVIIYGADLLQPLVDRAETAAEAAEEAASVFLLTAPPGFKFAIIDSDDQAAFGIMDDGTVVVGSLVAGTVTSDVLDVPSASTEAFAGAGNFPANINHILSYGQSNGNGTETGSVLTATQRFDNLRFSGGVRTQDSGTPYTSLVPLIETANGIYKETPIAGCTDMIKERIADEDGIVFSEQSFQLLGSAPAEGGATLAGLVQGQAPYTRLIANVTNGATLAAAAGKTYKAIAVLWLQGESDTGNTSYNTTLVDLRGDLDTDIKAITGQTEDVKMFCYDSPITDVVLEIQQAEAADPDIYIVAPIYQMALSDGVHFTAQSSKHWGAYAGLAIKRVIVDGLDWEPLRPVSSFRQGTIAEIKFAVPYGPLAFDTATLVNQTNYGFRLYQADGTTAMTISSVTITQPDTVRIVASASIPANAVLRYGFTSSTVHNRVFGGNLRDSDPTIFDGDGLDLPMHNWCICFERTL